jgi:hypothetical protein
LATIRLQAAIASSRLTGGGVGVPLLGSAVKPVGPLVGGGVPAWWL